MKLLRALAIISLFFVSIISRAADISVVTSKPDAIYATGETIRFGITWSAAAPPPSVEYTLKRGQRTEVGKGQLTWNENKSTVESSLEAPGTMFLELRWTDAEGKQKKAVGGAAAAPDQIKLADTRPADFDQFWEAKLKELAAVAPNPQVEPAAADRANVVYEKITLDNIRNTRIRGQLAKPAAGEKFPALLIVQWAGVYPLEQKWVTERAADGWLCLNILAHDLPIDQPADFYAAQREGALKDYWSIGNDDRETSYFLRMYLSCYRAAEYLSERPEWDGKTLVVMGGSQGGLQSLMTAAIHPKITAALASVPAGCDMLGPAAGRKGGWPQWYDRTGGKDAAKVHAASQYYDVAHFAPRIKCPVLISAGLIDDVCPPEGILATANVLNAPKEIVIMPLGDHFGTDKCHAAYDKRCWEVWLPALRDGKSPIED